MLECVVLSRAFTLAGNPFLFNRYYAAHHGAAEYDLEVNFVLDVLLVQAVLLPDVLLPQPAFFLLLLFYEIICFLLQVLH